MPVSAQFDDPYYSRSDGLAESRCVFLDGADVCGRWRGQPRFTIAELGFGTGLNFCAVLSALRTAEAVPDALDYVAFERFPLSRAAMAQALAAFPDVAVEARALCDVWREQGGVMTPGSVTLHVPVTLHVIVGDAREEVPAWQGRADAWFLDGFAPARNPEMWGAALLSAVHGRTVPGGEVATYSAAGAVRRGLIAAGFEVSRLPGYGHKRERLAGRRAT